MRTRVILTLVIVGFGRPAPVSDKRRRAGGGYASFMNIFWTSSMS